ncbi:MAG: type II toxin-antitoxin system VapC family toxin [Myxococcota bacterium]
MTTYVLDASVAIAWYLPEEFAAAAREWQRKMLRGEATFLVPRLHYWEVCNVLRTYVRRGELEPALAHEVYELHLDAPLELTEPDSNTILQTALEFDATTYDAVYIQMARSLDAPLITAERTTTPWVVKMGDAVRTVSRH